MDFEFNHEKLDAYKVAMEFLVFAFQLMEKWPAGYGFMSSHLKDSSLSIPLNIAEGNGKYDQRDKAKFYKIARGSANECSAILDAAHAIKLISKEDHSKGRTLLYREVCMLSKMIV